MTHCFHAGQYRREWIPNCVQSRWGREGCHFEVHIVWVSFSRCALWCIQDGNSLKLRGARYFWQTPSTLLRYLHWVYLLLDANTWTENSFGPLRPLQHRPNVSSSTLTPFSLFLSLFFREQITLRRGVCLHLSGRKRRGAAWIPHSLEICKERPSPVADWWNVRTEEQDSPIKSAGCLPNSGPKRAARH